MLDHGTETTLSMGTLDNNACLLRGRQHRGIKACWQHKQSDRGGTDWNLNNCLTMGLREGLGGTAPNSMDLFTGTEHEDSVCTAHARQSGSKRGCGGRGAMGRNDVTG